MTPDQALIKHLARQERFRNGHELKGDDTEAQEINCCVVWARPPPILLDTIQIIQNDLVQLLGSDLYFIPRKDLHLSVIELSHRHTVLQLRSVADEIGSTRIQDILDLVSTLETKPRLVAPTISFDKMGIALNFLPCDADSYTYHHLRSDMHELALESGIKGIDMCYTAPSAHITIGRFIDNKAFDSQVKRLKFVQLVQDLNEAREKKSDSWTVGESQGLELQLGYLKFGRECCKADVVGKV